MAFGKDVSASALAVVSAVTMPLALGTLALSAPSPFGAAAFAIIFGLGSGLFSIVSGTLPLAIRSEEHTSELQSLMRISYAVFCLKKKNKKQHKLSDNHI